MDRADEDAWIAAVRAELATWADGDPARRVDEVRAAITAGGSPRHAADLALAFAVAAGDRRALKRFLTRCQPDMLAAIRAVDHSAAFVDEAFQEVRIRLVVGDGEPPRIATYRGQGPLPAWAAIAARRCALNRKRAERRDAVGDPLADLIDHEPDAALRHLRSRYRTEVRAALTAALTTLSDRERALLRLRFVDGLELAPIAAMYRVHESTASRWITSARDRIATATRDELMARLAVTTVTADSIARMVTSGLDLSISRLLA